MKGNYERVNNNNNNNCNSKKYKVYKVVVMQTVSVTLCKTFHGYHRKIRFNVMNCSSVHFKWRWWWNNDFICTNKRQSLFPWHFTQYSWTTLHNRLALNIIQTRRERQKSSFTVRITKNRWVFLLTKASSFGWGRLITRKLVTRLQPSHLVPRSRADEDISPFPSSYPLCDSFAKARLGPENIALPSSWCRSPFVEEMSFV